MKNMFKLAVIAVSMALVTSLVACSSGDDDVVDTTTAKYLVEAQIAKYVDSITYCENVTDAKIEEFKKAHDAVMTKISDCVDCLDAYCALLQENVVENNESITLEDVNNYIKRLDILKGAIDEKEFHRIFVYYEAIEEALAPFKDLRRLVLHIDDIKDGKLNDRQAANMQDYIDAVKALEEALNNDDKKTYKTTIDTADNAIEAFGKLTSVSKSDIETVIDAVNKLYDIIYEKVVVVISGEKTTLLSKLYQ